MATAEKTNKLFQEQINLVNQLTKSVKSFVGVANQLNNVTNTQAKNQSGLSAKANELNTAQRKLIATQKERKNVVTQTQKIIAKGTIAEEKNTKKLITEKLKLAETNKRLRKEAEKDLGLTKKRTTLVKSFTKSLLATGAAYLGISSALRFLKTQFKIVQDFSVAQSKLASILGKTKKEITDLSLSARKFGSITKFTATEVSGLQLELAKLGFITPEIKASTEAILDFAAATGAELSEAASVAGGALRAFNLDAGESERVASVLAVSTTKSALQFEDFGTILGTVAPIANKFGLQIEDTIAVLGKLRDSKFDASKAATAFRNILLKLSDPASNLTKRFGGVATTSEELFRRLKVLKDEGVDLGEVLELTDVRASAAFATMIDGVDDVNDLKESITGANDELAKMVETQLDNLTGDITQMKSAWSELVIAIDNGSGAISRFFRSSTQGLKDSFTALSIASIKTKDLAELSEAELEKFLDATGALSNEYGKAVSGALDIANKSTELSVKGQTEVFESGLRANLRATKFNEDFILKLKQGFRIRREKEVSEEAAVVAAAEDKRLEKIEQDLAREERLKKEAKGQAIERANKLKEAFAAVDEEITKEDEDDFDIFPDLDEEVDKISLGMIKLGEESADAIDKLTKEGEKIFAESAEARLEKAKEDALALIEVEKMTQDAKIDLANNLFDFFGTLQENRIAKLDEEKDIELERINERYDAQIEAAQKAGKDTTAIEAKKNKEIQKLDKKTDAEKRKLARKAAVADKAQRIFQAIINTATGVTASLAIPVGGLALAAIVAAAGAVQIATIAAQPLPALADGGIAPGGNVLVSDDKSSDPRELFMTPDGLIGLTPPKESVMSFPQGTKVFPSYSEETKSFINNGGMSDGLLRQVIIEQQLTRKALSQKPPQKNTYFTKDAIDTIIETEKQKLIHKTLYK